VQAKEGSVCKLSKTKWKNLLLILVCDLSVMIVSLFSTILDLMGRKDDLDSIKENIKLHDSVVNVEHRI